MAPTQLTRDALEGLFRGVVNIDLPTLPGLVAQLTMRFQRPLLLHRARPGHQQLPLRVLWPVAHPGPGGFVGVRRAPLFALDAFHPIVQGWQQRKPGCRVSKLRRLLAECYICAASRQPPSCAAGPGERAPVAGLRRATARLLARPAAASNLQLYLVRGCRGLCVIPCGQEAGDRGSARRVPDRRYHILQGLRGLCVRRPEHLHVLRRYLADALGLHSFCGQPGFVCTHLRWHWLVQQICQLI